MARAINGTSGTGSLTVYTLSPHERFRLESLSFDVVASAAGALHYAEVLLRSQDGSTIARVPDRLDVTDGSTVTYTFGVGLTPSCGLINSGLASQNDLPVATLEDGCSVVVRVVDPTGAVIAADAISAVLLWVQDVDGAPTIDNVVPPYTPLEILPPVAA